MGAAAIWFHCSIDFLMVYYCCSANGYIYFHHEEARDDGHQLHLSYASIDQFGVIRGH
jgi:hypothetical protein